MSQIKLLYPFASHHFVTFFRDMADCMIEEGFEARPSAAIPWRVRSVVSHLGLCRKLPFVKAKEPVVVLCGGYPDIYALPCAWTHEIIPVLWDTWPKYWPKLLASLKRLKVKKAIFTQRQVCEYVQKQLPEVECHYMPEAVKPDKYDLGEDFTPLAERSIDVLEFGRRHHTFHEEAMKGEYTILFQGKTLVFPTDEDFKRGLNDSKIVVCFPQCMTNPEYAGEVETLTQRYWEGMFSRSVILGHAPKELVDLVGYNPVVEVDWENIPEQITEILTNIADYQDLVDKNYRTAHQFGDWHSRAAYLKKILNP